ncbi:MAG: LUD domain-containing protein [Bacteroidales bacterium]|nr:LUD domain-containing protein [Bacteroidales bacterium]
MQETTAREQILKKIRLANMEKVDNEYSNIDLSSSIYTPLSEDLDIVFAQELNQLEGHFVYCANKEEFLDNINRLFTSNKLSKIHIKDTAIINLLSELDIKIAKKEESPHNINISVTACEALVARLGSVVVSSKQESGRQLNFIPDIHVVIANRSQIVETVKDAITLMLDKYKNDLPSMTTIISGPSRTADIEKTLVLGAHGPRSLIVFLTEDNIL